MTTTATRCCPRRSSAQPKEALDEGDHEKNNPPDCLSRWRQRKDAERHRHRRRPSEILQQGELLAAEGQLATQIHRQQSEQGDRGCGVVQLQVFEIGAM